MKTLFFFLKTALKTRNSKWQWTKVVPPLTIAVIFGTKTTWNYFEVTFFSFFVCDTPCHRAQHRPIASQVVSTHSQKKQVISFRSSKSFPTSTFPLDWTRRLQQTGENFTQKVFCSTFFSVWTNRKRKKTPAWLNTCEHWISKVAVLVDDSIRRGCRQHCYWSLFVQGKFI